MLGTLWKSTYNTIDKPMNAFWEPILNSYRRHFRHVRWDALGSILAAHPGHISIEP
jgi:hypothetical protein